VLHNIKMNLMLHVSSDKEKLVQIQEPLSIFHSIEEQAEIVHQGTITDKEPNCRDPPEYFTPRAEVNISNASSRFQVLPYTQCYEQDPDYIRGGTVIRLRHSEMGGYLASDNQDFTNDDIMEIFLWNPKQKGS